MKFLDGFFDWAGKHPFLTTGMVITGGALTYKIADKALDVTERTAKRAINRDYGVKVGRVSVSPRHPVPAEEMIVDEEGYLTVDDR